MRSHRRRHPKRLSTSFPIGFLLLLFAVPALPSAAVEISNGAVTMRVEKDGTLDFINGGGPPQKFQSRFIVLRAQGDPGHKLQGVGDYPVPAWPAAAHGGTKLSIDPYHAGQPVHLLADSAGVANGVVTWHFPAQKDFQFTATVRLTPGRAEPALEFRLKALTPGSYSVAYVGAPPVTPASVTALWQPMLWLERRFPKQPILSTENMCPLPAALVEAHGVTVGVAADPSQIPFRLPTNANACCGVTVRDHKSLARPVFFAPVLGRPGSALAAGGEARFILRLIARQAGWYPTLRDYALGTFGLGDVHENFSLSLNQTLENEIAFAMDDDKSGWIARYRGFDYDADAKNTVKVVSALDPVSLAIVTDDEAIWRRRGRPLAEFMLSRAKYLFSYLTPTSIQGGVRKLDGPTGEVFEWTSLSAFAQGRCPAFIDAAHERFEHPRALNLNSRSADTVWIDDLAMYDLTRDPKMLARAADGARAYIDRRITHTSTDFSGMVREAQFWTDFTPHWQALLELYDATRDPAFLQAALDGARWYASLCWMTPPLPSGDVTVDGQSTPPWRVAPAGLTPEACNTATVNPAVFMSQHAPWLLRLGYLAEDPLMRTLARSAVIGRYASFPGYTIRDHFSLANSAVGYASQPKFKHALYFTHVWPHIAMILDYLISEAWVRSGRGVDFPAEYAQGYAYIQSQVYGARPGSFYGDPAVMPYMPAALAAFDTPQINYVAGRGPRGLYLAFMNESERPLHFTASLAPDKAGVDPARDYPCRVWQENRPAPPALLHGGKVALDIAPRGITAIAVDGAAPPASFQKKVASPQAPRLGPGSVATIAAPFGPVHASLITLGQGLTSAYLWTPADETRIVSAHLRWRPVDGTWQDLDDPHYPFDFSVPLDDSSAAWEFQMSGKSPSGAIVTAPIVRLGAGPD